MGPSITRMIGRDIILGINFHPHTACCFINDKAALFSNNIFDLCDVFGNDMALLHEALLSDNDLTARINILETFLVTKLRKCKIEEKRTAFLDYITTSLRSEEHTSELQSLMRISYAVFCLTKNKNNHDMQHTD